MGIGKADIIDLHDTFIEGASAIIKLKFENLKLKIINYRRALRKLKNESPDDPRIPKHEENLSKIQEKYERDIRNHREEYLQTRTKVRKLHKMKDVK